VDEGEALKLLATLDPLAAMAGADVELLETLVADVATDSEAVRALLNGLLEENAPLAVDDTTAPQDVIVPTLFRVLVECQDEHEQRGIFERLSADGFKCRVVTL
jgi:hypothetical protein